MKKIALSIAGFDPISGAGITADIKTFSDFGVYGVSVAAAITCQNTLGVKSVYPVSNNIIIEQLETLLCDICVDAVKTGMLYDAKTIDAVCGCIYKYKLKKLIVDPVLYSSSGAVLLNENAVGLLKDKLIPVSYLITPNLSEAGILCGFKVDSVDDMKKAAKKIHQFGARFVLIKGGHLTGNKVMDLLYDGSKFTYYEHLKISDKDKGYHGTGCALSSAIAALAAKGRPLTEAVSDAIDYTTDKLQRPLDLGQGSYLL